MRPPALLALALLAPASASGAGEDQWRIAAGAGYGTVQADGRTPHGAAAGLDLEYGLSDAWAARLSGSFSLHPVSGNADKGLPGGKVSTEAAVAGLTYSFDTLRFVPALEIGLGMLRIGGDVTRTRINLGAELGLAADYYLAPRWLIGGVARYLFAPADMTVFPPDFSQTPFFFSFAVRVSRDL